MLTSPPRPWLAIAIAFLSITVSGVQAQDRSLENLRAVAKATGYIRYFCPDAAGLTADWEALTRELVIACEDAPNARSLADRLSRLIGPVAPSASFTVGGRPDPVPLKATGTHALARVHHSLARTDAGSKIYFCELVHLPLGEWDEHEPALPRPGAPLVRPIGGDLWCAWCPAIYADAEPRSLPDPIPASKEPLDRPGRIAVVISAWNVFQHFYPYHHEAKTDMDRALTQAIAGARACSTDRELLDVLRRLVASLNDGHGLVQHASDPRTHTLPLSWDILEDKLVITASGTAEAHPGDIVRAIDGIPALDRWNARAKLVSAATPGSRRFKTGQDLLFGGEGGAVLTLEGAEGTTRDVRIARIPRAEGIREVEAWIAPRPLSEDLGDGLLYVNLDQISREGFDALLPDLSTARGIVFDLRGYPRRSWFGCLSHLTRKPIAMPTGHIPLITLPDQEDVAWDSSTTKMGAHPLAFTSNVAFLIDGRVVSAAEHLLGTAEGAGIGTFVGETTAGTNGNINPVDLPGGFRVVWTGLRITKPDDSRHHGVGIKPHIACRPTIAGVRAGRDEVLARAVEHLRANAAAASPKTQ